MPVDLVVRNGRLVLEDGRVAPELALVIEGGRIAAICLDWEAPAAARTIDARGGIVCPGFIDTHVHTRAPGYEHKEDFETCSAAAAAGGITTMLAQFNVVPPTTTELGCRNLIAHGEAHARVNFNLYALITSTNFGEIQPMANLGIASFKGLMGYKYEPGGEELACPADGPLLDAMATIADLRVPFSFHAENDEIIRHRRDALKAQGRKDYATHLLSRPNVAEEEAIRRLVLLSRHAGGKLHILHVSGKEGIEAIRDAKRQGAVVTSETCPPYLFMTNSEHVAKYGTLAKINPPIREQADQDALWRGIEEGYVDVIGTDHAPQTDADKMLDRPHEDMWAAASAFAGIETSVPLMLDAMDRGRLSMGHLVEICSTNAAKIFGLYPERGVLRAGAAADVAIVDPSAAWTIDRRRLHSKSTATPYDGWPVKGRVTHTIVRGEVVYDNGSVVGKPGHGRFVRAVHAATPKEAESR